MNIVRVIEKKRDGLELTKEEIEWFVEAYTRDDLPDYQAAALCMAIYLQGMNRRETVDLTMAMANSGDQLDLHDVAPFIIDKHSSGGVGDKTTLAVLPLVAACGVPVGKMSGRGLGSSGGTLDKMESISGWRLDLSLEAFKQQLGEIGLVLAGQTADLAPADGKLYALRDVTGTIGSLPLIASSIMSKKLAAGADAIVLDVKVGSGAFMSTVSDARELAQTMVDIGQDAGRKCVALLSDMNQPLGHAIGNALEVREAIDTLRGDDPPADFWEHCLEVAGHMLLLAGKAESIEAACDLATRQRDNGRAWEKFSQLVEAQEGDLEQIHNPEKLPQARLQQTVTAPRDGVISGIDTGAIGWIAVNLGGGRRRKGDKIDHAVGLVMPAKIGQAFSQGQPLCTVHANDEAALARACQDVLEAITWSADPVSPLPHFYGVVE